MDSIKRRFLIFLIALGILSGVNGCKKNENITNGTKSGKETTLKESTTLKKTRVESYISNGYEMDDDRYDSLINDQATAKTKYETIIEDETNKWLYQNIYFYSDVRSNWVLCGKEVGEDFFYLEAKWLLDYTEHDEPLWMPKTVVFYLLDLQTNDLEINGKQRADIDFVNRTATYYYYGFDRQKNEYYYTFMYYTSFYENGKIKEEKRYNWDSVNNEWKQCED